MVTMSASRNAGFVSASETLEYERGYKRIEESGLTHEQKVEAVGLLCTAAVVIQSEHTTDRYERAAMHERSVAEEFRRRLAERLPEVDQSVVSVLPAEIRAVFEQSVAATS